MSSSSLFVVNRHFAPQAQVIQTFISFLLNQINLILALFATITSQPSCCSCSKGKGPGVISKGEDSRWPFWSSVALVIPDMSLPWLAWSPADVCTLLVDCQQPFLTWAWPPSPGLGLWQHRPHILGAPSGISSTGSLLATGSTPLWCSLFVIEHKQTSTQTKQKVPASNPLNTHNTHFPCTQTPSSGHQLVQSPKDCELSEQNPQAMWIQANCFQFCTTNLPAR